MSIIAQNGPARTVCGESDCRPWAGGPSGGLTSLLNVDYSGSFGFGFLRRFRRLRGIFRIEGPFRGHRCDGRGAEDAVVDRVEHRMPRFGCHEKVHVCHKSATTRPLPLGLQP